MSNLNNVQIIGRLGRDPEVRYMADGKAVANIAVAVGEKWKDKQGQIQESTEWFNVSMFDRLGEVAGKYLTKGSLVYISGKQKTDKYTDNNGVEKYSVKLIANTMKMLSPKSEGSPQQAPAQQQPQKPATQPPAQKPIAEHGFDFDDDIPF